MRNRIKPKEKAPPRKWTVRDSMEHYNITEWGLGYFGINERGHLVFDSRQPDQGLLDIKEMLDQVIDRGIDPPILFRFNDILQQRLEELHTCFAAAIKENEYTGEYRGVYPIKVNQHRHVVEDLLDFGRKYNFGLEAGSKPELFVALALLSNPDALLICNGYKDKEFVDLALLGSKLGKKVILVVEKLSEVRLIVEESRALDVHPIIGIRAKLSARGSGKWEASGGDRSKFGLTVSEMIEAVHYLRQESFLDSVRLLHFHLGSQVSDIRRMQDALRESCQIFANLHSLGCPLEYYDVGGGLAVDYDGSRTNFPSSANYTMNEYAGDIVFALFEMCEKSGIPHPIIVSESGRALVAHHSMLVCEVLGTSEESVLDSIPTASDQVPDVLEKIIEVKENCSLKNFQESFHDALHYKEEALTLFHHGYLSLEDRARVENAFWAICKHILKMIRDLDYVPDELEGLERFMADIYYCNFSVFQSVPDHWAVKQLFPVVPIHRLDEKPSRQAMLADVTCDSDGKIDQFIDLRDVRNTLSLHPFKRPYYLGIFLIGAYQEILGDLHNLFGDTNTLHISTTDKGTYHIEKHIEGDTVSDVLGYVQYQPKSLLNRIRRAIEGGLESGSFTPKESKAFLATFEQGLRGYTYLEDE